MPDPLGDAARLQTSGSANRVKPWLKRELCRLIAAGESTQTELARRYGVTQSAICQFGERHSREIDEIKKNLDDEFAGLWIARKEARLSALEGMYQEASEHDKASHFEWLRTRKELLRAVADELGAIPNRSSVQVGGSVEYRLVGVDLDECFPEMPAGE